LTRIFLSTWGQNDNIGDSILRRGLLRSFQGIDGAELHVHVGRREPGEPNDEGYQSALGLRGDEVLYDRTTDWLRGAARSVFAKRTIMVLPAGEIVYPEIGRRLVAAGNMVLALAPRARGGTALQIGAGVRMPSVGDKAGSGVPRLTVPYLERASRRSMALVAWRESVTREAFGVGEVLPDWAFAEGDDPLESGLGPAPAQRKLLAVTTRWDRGSLDSAKIALVRRLADRHDLQLQVYSQVRRDREHTEQLARQLHPGSEPVLFGNETHAEWERVVRALHRRSAVVASDRAHALIIGATEGSIPLAFSNRPAVKPIAMLRAGGIAVPTDAESGAADESVENFVGAQLADAAAVVRPVSEARERIADARVRLRAIVVDAESDVATSTVE
jgi:hypothetical protein